ncbi:hypothetical protein [Rhizobium sp. F40D2]|uniref:hypothetical protein n=1 Tax=Rhizobium sp. F40D2 TaxID=3453141 RepID=UPI003F2137C2
MQALAGNKELKGKMLADHLKAWTPGSSLWYTKMATDRLAFPSNDRESMQRGTRHERPLPKEPRI